MIDAVFISDLHLHPNIPAITERFTRFVQWAAENTRIVYILGDFFHVWAGDDSLDVWSKSIASQLSWLVAQGVTIHYMHGNRDFLLGEQFAKLAGLHLLPDPSVIEWDGHRILLTHGDSYCTNDRGHQWLRRLTRNRLFPALFLSIPYRFRLRLVSRVRTYSEGNKRKPQWTMDIVPSVMLSQMQKLGVDAVIHGHIHKPGLTVHSGDYRQYVLSDWDDNPLILCYYKASGFCFIPFEERCNAQV